MRRRLPHGWPRVALLLLLLGAAAWGVSSDAFHALLTRLLEAARPVIAAHPFWGALLFVVLSALSAMLAFFSSVVLVPVVVHTWGEGVCVALLWLGWILGGLCAYGLAWRWGRPLVRRLTSERALARYEERISRRTPLGVVFLFQLSVPSEIPGYVLGLARFGVARYLLVLALAELPYAVGTVYLGESLLARRTLPFLLVGLLGIGLGAGALYALHRRLGR